MGFKKKIQQDQHPVQAAQPWFLQNGKITPDEMLRHLTPTWSKATWEKYLAWWETQRPESLVSPWFYKKICEEQVESIFASAQSNADDELKDQVNGYLIGLSEPQKKVIEMIFWEGRSERYVAKHLGINQKSAHRLKIRALNKIRQLIEGGLSSRIMRGEIISLSLETGATNDETVLELAQSDLQKTV